MSLMCNDHRLSPNQCIHTKNVNRDRMLEHWTRKAILLGLPSGVMTSNLVWSVGNTVSLKLTPGVMLSIFLCWWHVPQTFQVLESKKVVTC